MAQLFDTLGAPGPVNWEIASQLASRSPPRARPSRRSPTPTAPSCEELAHAAQTHVIAETGLAAMFAAPVRAMQRREWATLHLTALRPVLETPRRDLRRGLRSRGAARPVRPGGPEPRGLPISATGRRARATPRRSPRCRRCWPPSCSACRPARWSGTSRVTRSVGTTSRCRRPTSRRSLRGRNIDAFEDAWSLERADLRFYVAIHEVVHATHTLGAVGARAAGRTSRPTTCRAYEVDPNDLDERLRDSRFGDIDPEDPSSIQELADAS